MKRLKARLFLPFFVPFFLFVSTAFSQTEQTDIEELKKSAPKIFLDCSMCDTQYIKTEITYVNYVRDRKEAQVHILVTTRSTGSGGREYTISFIGQLDFEGVNDTHKYFSEQTETPDEIREGLVNALKVGLMSYVAKTPIASRINISYAEQSQQQAVKDRWDYWIFRLSGSARLNGQQTYDTSSLSSSISASRITEDLKIRMSASAHHRKEKYDYEDEFIESTTDSMYFDGLITKSLGDHWSVGAFFRADSSTYGNVQFSINPSPAIEFNLFPYSESTRKQLRFLYRFGYHGIKYREVTIYDKLSENLWNQSLSITLDLREKWGTVSTSLSGSHYFHDFSKNRIDLFTIVNVRLLKGLNVFALGGGSRIHDQLSLPKGGATREEVLLHLKQLETNYDYFFSVGFSFTFGSIFTNVVNPRFGSSGSGGMSIIID
jgi:hypothetical protein